MGVHKHLSVRVTSVGPEGSPWPCSVGLSWPAAVRSRRCVPRDAVRALFELVGEGAHTMARRGGHSTTASWPARLWAGPRQLGKGLACGMGRGAPTTGAQGLWRRRPGLRSRRAAAATRVGSVGSGFRRPKVAAARWWSRWRLSSWANEIAGLHPYGRLTKSSC